MDNLGDLVDIFHFVDIITSLGDIIVDLVDIIWKFSRYHYQLVHIKFHLQKSSLATVKLARLFILPFKILTDHSGNK